jgi:hypothetical protein
MGEVVMTHYRARWWVPAARGISSVRLLALWPIITATSATTEEDDEELLNRFARCRRQTGWSRRRCQ